MKRSKTSALAFEVENTVSGEVFNTVITQVNLTDIIPAKSFVPNVCW
ncbi:MAG TPA: hypothetical protein VIQ23_17220 [Hanamia sp.]|jgi:hypothetical protein